MVFPLTGISCVRSTSLSSTRTDQQVCHFTFEIMIRQKINIYLAHRYVNATSDTDADSPLRKSKIHE